MEAHFEDDDRDTLASKTNAAPPRKMHSYSQQLRPSGAHKNQHCQYRKHSLDEERIAQNLEYLDDSSDEEFANFNSVNPFSAVVVPYTDLDATDRPFDHSLSINVDGTADPNDPNRGKPLPDFQAGGGTGIFKAPVRAAVHPSRPPAIELRPHPLRETQVGKFLRTIGCTESHLWAGQESGVRFWDIREMYEAGNGLGGRVRRGDEDAAPFYESGNTPPTLCMVVDEGSRVVWTGHKDGKIRSWKMEHILSDESVPFREGLSWQAHKGPIIAMVISSYGDLWSGSEGGVIKVWPWESIEKSLSLSSDEKRMAALLVERSAIDLRSQVTVNGVCNISSSDIKVMLADHTRGRVWCATSMSFSLWDARTRELVKVFNIEGQIENRADLQVASDQAVEDEMKIKFVSQSKKEKPQGFLQRSRNAIMGAADVVRRVASRSTGAFIEDNKKTEALVMTTDGMIWSGCNSGLLIRWDGNGNRVQEFNLRPCAVLCFCTHGTRLWVGYASGVVQLLDLEGNIISTWVSHNSPVVKMVTGGGYVFSMATHGGIRAWSITSPGPIDDIIRTDLAAKEALYTRREDFKILVGTWNVGQGKASPGALKTWLGSAVSDVEIVVVGCQEVEMGAGFLAMSAAKETVGVEGSAIGQWWQDAIGKAIDERTKFDRVGSRQLAGLLIAIWVKKDLRPYVGDLDVAAVACGFGRTIGNKGGVGLRLRVHDRILCFVNCHLAAHLEAVNRRNADFDHIYRTMVFTRQSHLLNIAAAGVSSASLAIKTSHSGNVHPDEGRPDLSEADMVIFFGDFNYRLFGISYDEARDFVSQRSFDWLREKDQLRAEMKAGKVFQGMREAVIRFPPTYKFERNQAGLGGYDSGEKKRIPAWCDRIIYRDSRHGPVSDCSLDCPIVSSILMYEACIDVIDSDHKPVRCKFSVRLARVDRSVRRKEFGKVMNSNEQIKIILDEYSVVPKTKISTKSVVLQNQETSSLTITNKSVMDAAIFNVICEGQCSINDDGHASDPKPRACFGFPSWLEVQPATGIIKPSEAVVITIRHTEFHTLGDLVDGIPQNWRSEETRDKEVVLRIKVGSTCSTEPKTHHVRVRLCCSSETIRVVSRSNSSTSRRGNSNSRQSRSETDKLDNGSDKVDRG